MALAIASTALSSLPTRELHKKISLGKFTTCLPGRRTSHLDAAKGVSSVCEPLPPDRPLWFPGSSPPEWLDGSLLGDFGFYPLGLEKWLLGLWLAAVTVILLTLFLRFCSNSGGHNSSTCIQLPSVNTNNGFESASI